MLIVKREEQRIANEQNPFAHWDMNKTSGSIPQLKGARCFSFEEVKKYFSDANDAGSGVYGNAWFIYLSLTPLQCNASTHEAQISPVDI
ncbi:hypothetical protein AB3S75_013482 [Citrus x aurantiifolia]